MRHHVALGTPTRRLAVALAVLLGLTVTTAHAAPPKPRPTHITVSPTAAVVLVRATVPITGAVTPVGHGSLQLQVDRSGTWKTIATHADTGDGAFAFAYTTAPSFSTTALRVYRPAILTVVSAGFSPTIHIRTAATKFTVTANPTLSAQPNGGTLVVTGTYRPLGGGTVSLQRLSGTTWETVRTVSGSADGHYRIAADVKRGSYVYHVIKNPTATVATGASKPFRIGIDTPYVTTGGLPKAAVGVLYTQKLAADGGVPPYSFAVAPLPAGLTVSKAGVLSGHPTTLGTTTITVTVADAKGYLGTKAFTLVISPVNVLSQGDNSVGTLGNGTTTSTTSFGPTLLPPGSVKSVSEVFQVGVALKTDGTVWTWGYNDFATYPGTFNPSPVQMPSLQGIIAIASTGYGGMALKPDGTVWAWGRNDYGQLGNGALIPSATPVQVSGLSHVVAITGGLDFALALLDNGKMVAWGSGADNSLGDGIVEHNQLTPVPVVGGIGATPSTRAVAIFASWYTGFAILADGSVMDWGDPTQYGQSRPGKTEQDQTVPAVVPELDGVVSIAGTEDTSIGLRADGTVIGWGNDFNNLFPANTANRSIPVVVPGATDVTAVGNSESHAYAVRADGSVLEWGTAASGPQTPLPPYAAPAPVPGLKNVVALSTGLYVAFATVAAG